MTSNKNSGGDDNSEAGNGDSIRRRRFLGGVGATVLSSPLVGSAAADEPDAMAMRERANRIRRKAGQRAWKKFLRSQGFALTSTKVGMKLNEGGVGTHGFDNVDGSSSDCDICLDFSLYVGYSGVYSIDMFWQFDSEKWVGGGGYAPVDALGLYFDPQQWNYESNSLSDTTYTSGDGIVTVEDDSINDGLPFVVDDVAADDGTYYWAGLNIVPVGNYTSSERYVYGEYVHTWNVTETNYSVGASYPAGVSISFDTTETVKKESTGTEGDGDTMMILNQSDAVL